MTSFIKKGEHDGKAIWIKCGALIKKDNDKRSLKIDVMLVNPDWNGWLVVSERKARNQRQGVSEIPAGENVPF